MKKAVIILIGIIYGLSIMVVTLYGLNYLTFNETVYVTQVEIIEPNAKFAADTGMKYVVLSPDEDGRREYQIEWEITPDNATNQKVSFSYDTTKSFVTVDENGLVTFTSPGVITVTVIAMDGTSYSDTIKIYFKN